MNADIRTQIRILREDAGIGRAEMARRSGVSIDGLRKLEDPEYGPLATPGRRHLLRVLRVLCEAEGCNYRVRMRRVREALGFTLEQASKGAGFADPGEWRRLETDKTTPLIHAHVRAKLDRVLTKWERLANLQTRLAG